MQCCLVDCREHERSLRREHTCQKVISSFFTTAFMSCAPTATTSREVQSSWVWAQNAQEVHMGAHPRAQQSVYQQAAQAVKHQHCYTNPQSNAEVKLCYVALDMGLRTGCTGAGHG